MADNTGAPTMTLTEAAQILRGNVLSERWHEAGNAIVWYADLIARQNIFVAEVVKANRTWHDICSNSADYECASDVDSAVRDYAAAESAAKGGSNGR